MFFAAETAVDQAKQAAVTWKEKISDWFTNVGMWENILFSCIRIVIILVITRLFIKLIFKFIDHSLRRHEDSRLNVNPRRFVTVGELLKNVISIATNFVMIMLLLSEFGVNLAPLLAGAGVFGLAVGFGAQSLVKDVITGFFIILEDQFAVGDVIQTGTFKGTVEIIGLRTTRLVSWTGEVHIIPNGMITNVTNYSLNNALAVVDIPISSKRKLDESLDILKKSMTELKENTEALANVPNVLGVQSMTTSEYVVRIVGECLPGRRAEVEREIQSYAKEALEEAEGELAAEA
ncbi:mechanosensitive ion channel family protein [Paenibacillus sp. YPG26]|uniref:mechanosensitive ion channel family protein n=1 Tax=Paenibacillus sp. YPG26 TaxID=2878915 RepID=UPI00203BBE98|nr:mechanosensitive ion channel family protein [Paenibacillus sp. YPG26]USB33254.1 mechanosensitive ion channel family protein [Paenibacillus sp. YPG26]